MKKKSRKKWGRFGFFVVIALVILGLTAGTSMKLWKSIPLGLDLKGGVDLLYEIQAPHNQLTKDGINAAVQAVEMRVNTIGVASPVIQVEDGNHIRVEMAGVFDQQKAAEFIGKTADLEMYGQAVPSKDGKTLIPPPNVKPLATGADLKSNSRWATDQLGQNVVTLEFKDSGKWQSITKQYLHKQIYTFLNGQLLTAPTIQDVMSDGKSQISGGSLQTVQDCQTLANELNAGALPYPLNLISSTNVGPSLGFASLQATMWAGLLAIFLIFLFMLVLYRAAGLIANLALVAYLYLVLLTFAGMHVVLTLPGLAALVLGVGMAVDANIITYERIKDEMRNGKSLQSAVVSGNQRALRAIIDSNATTFIAGAVMYWFGQGDIRGFAVALMISIIVSLLTAVLLSRAMLLLFTKSNVVNRPWWFGIRKGVVQQ